MGVTEPHTNAKAPTHHRGSTEEEGGRSKPCFPCATNDAACDGSWTRAIDGSVLQRRSSAARRDLLLEALELSNCTVFGALRATVPFWCVCPHLSLSCLVREPARVR